jgi:hypothetical protein
MTSIVRNVPPILIGDPPPELNSGIVLEVFPGNETAAGSPQRAGTAIERAKDSTGTPGSPSTGDIETVAFLPAAEHHTYLDSLPADESRWHYRARHWRIGWTDSAATGWVDAKPKTLDSGSLQPVLVGQVYGLTDLVSATTGRESKILRIGPSDVFPLDQTTYEWGLTFQSGGVYLNSGSGGIHAGAAPALPPNAEVYKIAARVGRNSTADAVEVALWWSKDAGSTEPLAGAGIQVTLNCTATSTSIGLAWQTVESSTFTPRVHRPTTGQGNVTLRIEVNGAGSDAGFGWADLYYRVDKVKESVY